MLRLPSVVEIDLRLPSMQHGKKGFKRVQWAAERVLNRLLRWIFCDLTQNGMEMLTDADA